MKRRIFSLIALLALTWVSAAQAVGYCSASYCANQPWNKPCGCPPESDRPGAPAYCGTWTVSRACWNFESTAGALQCPAGDATAPEAASVPF